MVQPKISLIATTYNQSRDLQLYLTSLSSQIEIDQRDVEVLIADDGSKEDTLHVIAAAKRDVFGERLVHVWHEDLGYRKCKILNAAIRKARGNWLVFTDTDLILHPLFLADHLSMASPGRLFMGRRVDLGPHVSQWLREYPGQMFSLEFYVRLLFSRQSRGIGRGIRIGSPWLQGLLGRSNVPDLLGSNFSIDRTLLEKVNGFDENREQYWGEDGDLFVRARNIGATIVGRKNFAVQFHLWHQLRRRLPEAENEYFQKLQDQTYLRCRRGLTVDGS